MQYLGGKSRIAKHLAPIILEGRGDRDTYLEPFLGAGSVFVKVAPHFPRALGADAMPDLVMLWNAVQRGWVPPTEVSEEEYRSLRNAEPSALRGFVGFACSFGGKWWGGYARQGKGYSYAAGGSRSITKKVAAVPHACFAVADYRGLPVSERTVVYADPPYAGTTPYAGAPPWDAETFWATAREWVALGAAVFVSEYQAPEGWTPVWSKDVTASLVGGVEQAGRKASESLFTFTG